MVAIRSTPTPRLGQQTDPDVKLTNKQFETNLQISITNQVIKPMEQIIGEYSIGMKSNTEPVCVELYVLQHVQAVIEKGIKLATKRAIDCGVLFDHKKNPLEAGTTRTLLDGDRMLVAVDVTNSGAMLDPVKAKTELVLAGVDHTIVLKCFDEAMKAKAASHKFKITVKE